MTTVQIAFSLLALALFLGFALPSWACLFIALALGLALWLEDRAHRRGHAS